MAFCELFNKMCIAENSFLDFSVAALKKVGEWIQQEGLPMVPERRVEFRDDGFEFVEHRAPVYSWFLGRFYVHNDRYSPIHEAEKCARVHFEKSIIPLPEIRDSLGNIIEIPTFDQVRDLIISELTFPIQDIIEQRNSIEVSVNELADVYRRYREKWSGKTVLAEVLIPLHGIDLSFIKLPISINEDMNLRYFKDVESGKYWSEHWFYFGIHSFISYWNSNVVIYGVVFDRSKDTNKINEYAKDFITSLRLLAPGGVGAVMSMTRPKYKEIEGISSGALVDATSLVKGKQLLLSEKLLDDARILSSHIFQLRIKGSLSPLITALRRFNQSYIREKFEDRVIDLTIALEASILFGIKDELKYRLALRCSNLLSSTRKPNETFNFVRDIYDLRSLIVHQGLTANELEISKGENKKLYNRMGGTSCVEHIEQIVREVLHALIMRISDGLPFKEVIFKIDEEIVGKLEL